jgi:hypothetical protein
MGMLSPVHRVIVAIFIFAAAVAIPAWMEFNRSSWEFARAAAAIFSLGLFLAALLTLRRVKLGRARVYFFALIAFLGLIVVRFGLGDFRANWHDRGVTQGFAGYYDIVEAQYIIDWAFDGFLIFFIIVGAYEVARFISYILVRLKINASRRRPKHVQP